MSEEKLKACPFCGGEAEVRDTENQMALYVACLCCQSASCLVYQCGEPALPILIEKWNRRAEP